MLHPLANHLRARGWPAQDVATVSFIDPFGSNREHAAEIAQALDTLVAASGHTDLAVVAHSMGGLGLRWYLAHHDDARIRTAIFLATPHRGTWLAWLGWGPGASEMRPSSPFLRELQAHAHPPHVRTISFRAPWDTRLVPPTSAWLADTEHRVLPALGHKRILRHRAVMDAVVEALEES